MIRLKLVKHVLIAGQRHDNGSIVETDDSLLVDTLIAGGKAEPASAADAKQLRERSVTSWSKGTAADAGRDDPRWIQR